LDGKIILDRHNIIPFLASGNVDDLLKDFNCFIINGNPNIIDKIISFSLKRKYFFFFFGILYLAQSLKVDDYIGKQLFA